jgi:hypothetical protein
MMCVTIAFVFCYYLSAISKQVPEEKQHEAAAPHARKFDG